MRKAVFGKADPIFVRGKLQPLNAKRRLIEIDKDAQVLSLLLEAATLLTGAEESRMEGYLAGQGEFEFWRMAAKRASQLASQARGLLVTSTAESRPEDWANVCSTIERRAEVAVSIPGDEARKDPRHKRFSHDPQGVGPVFVPKADEMILADKALKGHHLAKLIESIGLREAIESWTREL